MPGHPVQLTPLCGAVLSHFSHVLLFATLWIVACQVYLSMAFSRQEYWSGLPFLLQWIFLTQELNLCLLGLLHGQVGSLPLVPSGNAIAVGILTFCNQPHSVPTCQKDNLNKYLFACINPVLNSANEAWMFSKSTWWVIKIFLSTWSICCNHSVIVLEST